MNLAPIARLFCEDVLPVFDRAAVWLGRAETDGQLTLLASAEGRDKGVLQPLRERALRWDGEPKCCLSTSAVIRGGQGRTVVTDAPQCQASVAQASCLGSRAIMILPLTLRGVTWGVLTLYGHNAYQFDGDQLPPRLATIASRLGLALESALQQEWLTLLDTAVADVDNSVLITDAKASIIWVNRAFIELSGFASEEILGRTPTLLRSGEQDSDFYGCFWRTIAAGAAWHGDMVNARRDGSRYTVSQTVAPYSTQKVRSATTLPCRKTLPNAWPSRSASGTPHTSTY